MYSSQVGNKYCGYYHIIKIEINRFFQLNYIKYNKNFTQINSFTAFTILSLELGRRLPNYDLLRFSSVMWIRIRPDPHSFGSLHPNPEV